MVFLALNNLEIIVLVTRISLRSRQSFYFILKFHIQDQKYALLPKEDGDVKQSASSNDKPEAENWDNDW